MNLLNHHRAFPEIREYIKQKEDLIRQLTKGSNLSKRKIAILIGVSRETVRRVSEEPSLWQFMYVSIRESLLILSPLAITLKGFFIFLLIIFQKKKDFKKLCRIWSKSTKNIIKIQKGWKKQTTLKGRTQSLGSKAF